jgi:dTDP-4-amino-4,6-dideoxygalactose transaminase
MKIPFFSLDRQVSKLRTELNKASASVFGSSQFVSGNFTKRFELEFAQYIGVTSSISCGNATDGLELVLRAMDIGVGDEVIVPAFTWISDAEAVSLVGATPVFAEVDADNFNVAARQIEDSISPKTKAIIFTHLFGYTGGFEAVTKVAEKHKLKLIEDCAQAHGAAVNGKKAGSLGDAGVFSFYPTKNLGAYGDAGAITTNDDALAEKIRLMANHGQMKRDIHIGEGRNSRMDELQAAFLLVKLGHLDEWNQRRNEIAQQYLTEIKGAIRMPEESKNGDHVYHQFVIQSENRNVLKLELEKVGIGVAIHYPNPLPLLDAYHQEGYESKFELSKKISMQVLSLPIWPELNDLELEQIIKSVNSSI